MSSVCLLARFQPEAADSRVQLQVHLHNDYHTKVPMLHRLNLHVHADPHANSRQNGAQ